jgi:pyruvate kinase
MPILLNIGNKMVQTTQNNKDSTNYREKNTKIVATVSDLRAEPEFIQQLYDHGVDVIRLNTAHQGLEDTIRVIKVIRSVNNKLAILVDTKGPEIRTINFDEPIEYTKGSVVVITGNPDAKANQNCIPVSYPGIATDVPIGANILIDDGLVKFKVQSKDENRLHCLVENTGTLKKKKTVNTPNVHINLPSLTEKDISFIRMAAQNDVDFIAHSFVRHKEDCMAVQKILDETGSKIQIIAKIENQQGVDNIDEILDHCYGIMVARGDLGVEVPASQVPFMQKHMIRRATEKAKPVIVATQMLESMIKNPRPTRAEVSDVANAILDGTSAIMLSGETAYGDYPIEAVRTMSEIALELKYKKEEYLRWVMIRESMNRRTVISKSIVHMAVDLSASAIIIPSSTGETARVVSSFHCKRPVYAFCYDERTMRKLSLCYGVRPGLMPFVTNTDELVQVAAQKYLEEKDATENDLIIVGGSNPQKPDQQVNFIEIDTVKNCMELEK